ncbi:hypothetical protein AK830_g3236 [Neonectria ditissima]|uniref:Amidoligase enzyme n=1 Tax=Neonectria ditissima TaxID=78410 RepID=A0A0P7BQW4_9HYPO|nr:hypothetical protein AK830_g3236 [Neonectria ditissima]
MFVPDSVCLGIEVEFLAAQHLSETSRIDDGDHRWVCDPPCRDPYLQQQPIYKKLTAESPHHWPEASSILKSCEILANLGLPAACPCPSEPDSRNPISQTAPAGSVFKLADSSDLRVWNKDASTSRAGDVSRSDYWFVVRERHITEDIRNVPRKSPTQNYYWYGTELNSPVLTRPEEFSQGLPTLRRSLTAIQDNMKVAINAGCGLHLHVNDAGKMDLQTAQRVACLVHLLEDSLLMPLSHPSRHTSPYSARISVESKIAMQKDIVALQTGSDGAMQLRALEVLMGQLSGRSKVDNETLEALRRIYSQPDLHTLGQALRKFDEGPVHTTRRCALVVSTKHNTIEFRYPASTFDADYIASWAALVRHIYAVAMAPADEFSQVLCRVYEVVTRGQAVGWQAVMQAIEFQGVSADEWKRCMRDFNGRLKDLDQHGILPPTK